MIMLCDWLGCNSGGKLRELQEKEMKGLVREGDSINKVSELKTSD
jgi:hypothetical protein